MGSILHKLSKLFVILSIFSLVLTFSPKQAKATSWSFNFSYGGINIGYSNYYRPWGYYGRFYPGLYFPRYYFFYPTFYRQPAPLRLSAWQKDRLYQQSMALLRYKMTRYYQQKYHEQVIAAQNQSKINTNLEIDDGVDEVLEQNLDTDLSPDESQENPPKEPSTEFTPKEIQIADGGDVIMKLY